MSAARALAALSRIESAQRRSLSQHGNALGSLHAGAARSEPDGDGFRQLGDPALHFRAGLFGAGSFGAEDLASLVDSIAAAGFHGVVNFPSRLFLDGRYRQFLEECDMGFEREIALLKQARASGLLTLAYVSTIDEARLAAHAGVDIVNIEFGWNTGGSVGVNSRLELQDAAAEAARRSRRH